MQNIPPLPKKQLHLHRSYWAVLKKWLQISQITIQTEQLR